MRRVPALALALTVALAAGVLPLAARVAPARAATTFVVTTVGDNPDANPGDGRCDTTLAAASAPCSLRAAIREANAAAGADLVRFAIPGTGLQTIRPASPLPAITRPVTIDGYSQPGASPNTLAAGTDAVLRIELDGSDVDSGGASSDGLRIQAANAVVRGLVINRFANVGIRLGGATGTRIEGCFLGTTAAGTAARGNNGGVLVVGTNITIGGAARARRNLIAGNAVAGVELAVDASGTAVQGNLIGTDRTGAAPLGNGAALPHIGAGVLVSGGPNTAIGGDTAAAANVIAFNAGAGVRVWSGIASGPETGNEIGRNAIFENAGLGIDLRGGTEGADGATANDAKDRDAGPNNLQNKPVIASATRSGSATAVRGRLHSAPNAAFVVRVFSNPSGSEGRVFRGQANVVTDATGDAPIAVSLAQAIPVGHTVTATATSEGGDTSEFSLPVVARAG
jgi:CSLREA domain-containing protein